MIKVAAALSDLIFSAIMTTRTISGLFLERREIKANTVVVVQNQLSKVKF